MNPEIPKNPREELELRVTALLLGELSADEADAVRLAIAKDPELTKLHDDLKPTIRLVREATVSSSEPASAQAESIKLSEERRQTLLAHFKTVRPKEFAPIKRRPTFTLVELAAVLVIAALLASISIPNFVRSRSASQSNAIINNLRHLDGAKQQWALENKKSSDDVPTFEDIKPYMGRGAGELPPPVAGETYILGKVGDAPLAELAPAHGEKRFVQLPTVESAVANREEIIVRSPGASVETAEVLSERGKVAEILSRPATPRAQIILPAENGDANGLAVAATAQPQSGSIAWWDNKGGSVAEGASATSAPKQYYRITGGASGSGGGGGGPVGQTLAYGVTTNAVPLPEMLSEGSSDSLDLQRKSIIDPTTGLPVVRDAVALNDKEEKPAVLGDLPSIGRLYRSDVKAPVAPGQTASKSQPQRHLFDVTSAAAEAAQKQRELSAAGVDNFATTDFETGKSPSRERSKRGFSLLGLASAGDKVDHSDTNGFRYFLDLNRSTNAIAANDNFTRDAGTLDLSGANQFGGGTTVTLGSGVRTLDEVEQKNRFDSSSGNKITLDDALSTREPEILRRSLVDGRESDRIDGIGIGLRVDAEKGAVEGLNSGVEASKKADQEKAAKSRAYFAKKRELEDLQRSGTALAMKLAGESIDVTLPKTTMVEIVDKAEPPSGTNKTLWQRLSGEVTSTARIKVEKNQSDILGLSERQSSAGYDPYFVQTESEVIQSRLILDKVIENLNLNTEWGEKYADGKDLTTSQTYSLLKKKIELHPGRNGLLEIRVKSDKPAEAAKIANAVADAYQTHRAKQRRKLAVRGIDALKKEFDEQERKVREAEKEVERLRQELEVEPDIVVPRKSATNAPIPQPEIQTSESAFSTFSLNVSDVSFKLAAASLEKGQMPDPASVRSEEFINAFDYRDPEPPAGAPIAFAWERARYPFTHNRDLLRFSLKTAAAGRQAGRPLNIVLLLDNSGSMERADRVSIIGEALRVLASQLQPQDKLSVITFARTARLVADGISGDKAREVAEQVSGLTPQGGTNLEDAMNLAYQTAARHYLANGINRVVLLTDGAANLGNVEPDSLKQKVEAQRKQGIALDCFGIGWEGFNDDLLEVLSRNGDGRYGFINSPEEAATDFVGQLAGALKVAASDVKVQVEFSPKRVTAYRQIGYAKHQLTKEQFRDNTVDAAEIAAQEAGNALYTVEVNPAGEGPICTVRVRYKIPGATDYREQAWDVPYTGNAVSLEQSSPAMRLAASASAFSELLVASPFAGEVTLDRVLAYLSGVPEVYGADARPKKLEWMIRQAKSIEGE